MSVVLPPHNILSPFHLDTLTATVVRGDILIGNNTPKWSRLAVGSANRFLSSDGTDVSWAQVTLTTGVTGVLPVANGGTNASSASITAFNNITGYTASGATGTTSTNLVFSTSPSLTTPNINVASGTSLALTSFVSSTQSIGAVSTDGLLLTNTTPALTGAQQWSPRLHFSGQGFKSNAASTTQTADYIIELQPVQGATVSTANLMFSSQIAGGGYVARLALNSAGQLLQQNSYSVGVPFIANSASLTTGMQFSTTGTYFSSNGSSILSFSGAGFILANTMPFGWTSGAADAAANDTQFYRDGVGVITQRTTTAAQCLRIQNTFTTVDTSGEWWSQSWKHTSNQFWFGALAGSSAGTARSAIWHYGGLEASLTAAITVPATSGSIVFGGGITLPAAGDIVLDATTGSKIGTAATQKLGFYNTTPVVQQTRGGTLTNNVTSGGTTDQIDDFTSLTIYATDAAAIRNDIYQLARAVRQHDVALRALGLES